MPNVVVCFGLFWFMLYQTSWSWFFCWCSFLQSCSVTVTIQGSNIAPEKRPCQKERIIFQPQFFRGYLSFSNTYPAPKAVCERMNLRINWPKNSGVLAVQADRLFWSWQDSIKHSNHLKDLSLKQISKFSETHDVERFGCLRIEVVVRNLFCTPDN